MVAKTWTRTRRRRPACIEATLPGNAPSCVIKLQSLTPEWSEARSDQANVKHGKRSKSQHVIVGLKKWRPLEDESQTGSRLHPNRTNRTRSLSKTPCQMDLLPLGCLILIGVAAFLANTLPAQEIGEGLTLSHKFGNGAGASSGPQQRQQQQQLKQRQQYQELTADDVNRIKAENRVSAQLGQNVILNCPVQFKDGRERLYALEWLKHPHKLPIYLWHAGYPDHKAAGYESRVQRLGVASLNLSQVLETDQGLYECHIYYLDERPEDAAKPTRLFLDVLAPPRITIEPAPVSYVQAGDSLHLTCRAESMPAPVLRWYKSKQPIESNSGVFRTSSVILDSPDEDSPSSLSTSGAGEVVEMQRLRSQEDLFIDNIQAGQSTGDYKCLASNSEGSVEAHAQVILGVPAVITGPPKDQLKLEGERAEFQCQAKALPSNITHHWLFNDKPIQQLRWFENRHSVRRDGTLIIPSVHREDQGLYKCQATNGLSHKASFAGAPAQIAEASASLMVEFPARVTQSPSPQYLPIGLSGIVRCHVQAVPPVEFFTWTLNNQQFDAASDSNIERLLNGSLLIKQVTRSYRGTYRCTPFNKHGTAGSSAAMEVRVEEPPMFMMRPADFYKAAAGGHVSMACEGRGEPPPVVSWRRVVGASTGSGSSQHSPKSAAATSNELEASTLQVPNDEPDSEEHDLYARHALAPPRTRLVGVFGDDETTDIEREKQSVILYAPPPAERSDYKNSHLLMHGLRKEDHGRYECVIENEVATLVASTMLYIEETSPHAPKDVQVETKRWSAVVSWTPGYDGGFEQSFTVWYRQVGPPTSHQQASGEAGTTSRAKQPADFNWRSASVRPPDATTLEVQNLTQNTAYEFCVHAKNIIGEGPRSPVVMAVTKLASISQLEPQTQDETKPEDAEQTGSQSTMNPAILGIIHLVDYTTGTPQTVGGARSTSQQQQQQQQAESASETFLQLYPTVSHTQESLSTLNSSSGTSSSSSSSSTTTTSKVIKIILPNQPYLNSTSSTQSPENLQSTSKRSRPNDSRGQHQPQDPLTAPQNLKMTKVAQGWVLSWSAPPIASTFGHLSDGAPVSTVAASQVLEGQKVVQAVGGTSATYLLEYREKGGAWHTVSVPPTQERSMLLKDLKPGEYLFRVYAADSQGLKGSPSLELSQTIPDYRRKPGSTQALSAGVVSGMLFFIACIVIAVCTVNMCNKRRKKRAEKAAYVMMACPVLESHHDIEALNTNSLMKNTNGSQNRVPSVNHAREGRNDRKFIDKLSSSLNCIGRRLLDDEPPPPPPPPLGDLHKSPTSTTRCIRYSASRPALPVDVGDAPLEQAGRSGTPSDHYWLLEPANSKWGTLTVATSRLAERRAREAQHSAPSHHGADKIGGQQEPAAQTIDCLHTRGITSSSAATQVSSSSTRPAAMADNNLQLQSQLLFESWLTKQLAGEHERAPPEAIPANTEAPRSLEAGGLASSSAEIPSYLQQPQQAGQFTNWHTGHSASFTYQQQQTPGWHQFQLQPTSCGPMLLHPAQEANLHTMQQHMQRRANSSYYLAPNGHWMNQQGWPEAPQQLIKPANQVAPRQLLFAEAARLGRNSIARRTLPLTAVNFMGQQLVHQAADYHHKSPPSAAHHQQADHRGQHYMASQHQLPPAELQQQQHDIPPPASSTFTVTSPPDDDPLTANACFGSYKRKRRLPHIEAQFTITPPQPQPRHLDLEGESDIARARPPISEREALENGHLFVRPTLPRTMPRRAPPPPPEPLPLPAISPPGMPTSGQRSEQQRLRGPLPQVGTMGAQEKIETYLRHYDEAQREPLDWLPNGASGPPDYDDEEEDTVGRRLGKAGKVVQTTEQKLIFQPYCNLPSLKYTISLPMGQTLDGSIILGETNELRLSKRAARRKTRSRTLSPVSQTKLQSTPPPPVPPAKIGLNYFAKPFSHKQRLGSSSSCPPVPNYHLTKDLPPIKKHHETSKYSLQSCLRYNQPSSRLLAITSPLDSLESVSGDQQPSKQRRFTGQPFYLRDIDLTDLVPPPVPPHKNTSQQPTDTTRNKTELSVNEASVNVTESSQSAFIQKNSESSNSPQSSSSPQAADLSPSSSETTNHENHSGNENCAAMSEVPTNSVDENYEFDQLSSSSSSIQQRNKITSKRLVETRAVSKVSTTTTRKQPPTGNRNNNDDELLPCRNQLVTTERSNLNDYSRCKLLPLAQMSSRAEVDTTSDTQYSHQATTNYYDTVYGETSESAESAPIAPVRH